MQWRKDLGGLVFSLVFIGSYFTNKFVLSVLKFTYPTLFQGWQTLVGAVLLLLFGKLGWVEMSRITGSAALSWLPASLLFVGHIYSGSRALSHIDIPRFFTLQNSSHVVSYVILRLVHREKTPWLKLISVCLMMLSATNLPFYDPQLDSSGYLWAVGHLVCVGAYRGFQLHYKSSNLSDLQQQCINYVFSVLFLGFAAPLTGDLTGVLDFPFLQSHRFHCGCCASALLGFLLLLTTVRLKTGPSLEHFGIWMLTSKVTAMFLCPIIFYMDINTPSLICVVISHVGEALLVYSDRES
ncbi:transmembrane protein 241 [Mastacembelus armatus]|uniref:Transmembrane protein 241 n=1 Tax=Mastacembelus armatus TaxID=205130 RepID=A0A3Q3MH16_9TELE|nr:transmembrane protein 241 [Mastacembelus armatus]